MPNTTHDTGRVRQGRLILSLQDLWDYERIKDLSDLDELTPGCSFGEFIDDDVLERWARGWSFNVGDIDPLDALVGLITEFLLPSIEELEDRHLGQKLQRMLDGDLHATAAPYYSLQVDGSIIRMFLVESYDGTFGSFRRLIGRDDAPVHVNMPAQDPRRSQT